jgi:hypothetical protein
LISFTYFANWIKKPPYMLQWVMSVLQTGLGYAAWPSSLPPRQEKAAMVAQTGGAKTASPAGHVRGPSLL